MAGSQKDFDEARGATGGLIPTAAERFGEAGSGPAKPAIKVVDQDSGQVTDLGDTIDERELARSRGSFVAAGGRTNTDYAPDRVVTTPEGRNANSKEALKALGEHHQILSAFVKTHAGAITTAGRRMPAALQKHTDAAKALSESSTHLAIAGAAFAARDSSKGNEFLKKAVSKIQQAHGLMNSTDVREVTGSVAPIHPDELASWADHTKNLPSFRRKGKSFPEVNVAGTRLKTGTPLVKEIRKASKGTLLGEKIDRANAGTPRTPNWEREAPDRPSRGEKGTGVIDTTTRGTRTGTTGEMDPRRKADNKSRIDVSLVSPNKNLGKTPKFEGTPIGDTPKDVSVLKEDKAKTTPRVNRGSKGGTYKGAPATGSNNPSNASIPSSTDTTPGEYGKARQVAINTAVLKQAEEARKKKAKGA